MNLTRGIGTIRALTRSALFLLLFLPSVSLSQQTLPTTTAAGDPILKVGSGVSTPHVVSKVDPQYSEEGRNAAIQGTVVMQAIIHKDGSVQIVRVARGIGFGLDEAAVQALSQWKFSPAMKDGTPVPVAL